ASLRVSRAASDNEPLLGTAMRNILRSILLVRGICRRLPVRYLWPASRLGGGTAAGIFPRLFHLWSHNVRPSRPRRLLQQLSYRLHAPRHRVVVPSRSLPGGCALYLLAQQKVLRRFSQY